MGKKLLSKNRICKYLSLVLSIALLVQLVLINNEVVNAEDSLRVEQISSDYIARGILLEEYQYGKLVGETTQYNTELVIKADLNDPTVNIMVAKAKDKVLAAETLTRQIYSEQTKGQNVVAGINGDLFNMSSGTADYGMPVGLQVTDGNIIVGFDSDWSQVRFPVFAIDVQRQPMVAYISTDARLINQGAAIAVDTVNRNNLTLFKDYMTILTPIISDNLSVIFTESQLEDSALVFLEDITGLENGAIKLGKEYQARVAAIEDPAYAKQYVGIPADGAVIASTGIKAEWVKEHIQAGDIIKFSVDIKDDLGQVLDLNQVITGWIPLVANGTVLSEEEMLERCQYDWDGGTTMVKSGNKARTAIGYTADNEIVALVCDGGGSTKYSYGISLPGMAERMKELGVVGAIALDGGGSTQMNSRLFGEFAVNTVNKPSDNRERSVASSILFTSEAPKTDAIGYLRVYNNVVIYKNNYYNFSAKAQDENHNPVDLSQRDVIWGIKSDSIDGYNSFINNNGEYIAGDMPGIEQIYIQVGETVGSATVTIVDSAHTLSFAESGVLTVDPDVPKQLSLKAYTEDGRPIIMSNTSAEWRVYPDDIASISNDGILYPDKKGNGTVIARVGDQEISIDFISGQDDQIIEDYNWVSGVKYYFYVNGYVGGKCEFSSAYPREGNFNSLRVDYDYSNWDRINNGSINIRMYSETPFESYTTYLRPKQLGMWVYGDGKAPWLRAIIKDGNDDLRTIDLSPSINWTGWKYVSAVIPEDIPLPITLEYYYMVETDKNKDLKGTVYFDEIRFVYSD